MTTPSSLNFGGTISQTYEDLLGPFIFEPFAVDFAALLDTGGTQNILELACGSGRLTQHIAAKLSPSAQLLATDLNADMVRIAQSKVASANISWQTVDMLSIPFPDNYFNQVVCQFGLMLAPDQMKALSEIYRVLKPGGKLSFVTWAAIANNPLWDITSKVLGNYLTEHPIISKPGPFAMSDDAMVLAQLEQSGFNDAKAVQLNNRGKSATAFKAASGVVEGLPVYAAIMAQAPALLKEIIGTLETELASKLGNNPLLAPQCGWLYEARK
jgi:ubiquinone/menaquinone biosynthesis C-methylase UbiE